LSIEDRFINVYYVAQQHFNTANPHGFLIRAVVIDDEVYTIPTKDFKEGKVRVNALPFSDLIDLKRATRVYDSDFEEQIAGILFQEEVLERRRFDLFRLEQENGSANLVNEETSNPAINPSYYEFIGAKKPDDEEKLFRSFIKIIDEIGEEKHRLMLLRQNKDVIEPQLYENKILELHNGMRSKFNIIQTMGVNFDDNFIK
jgi:hypothetical protein